MEFAPACWNTSQHDTTDWQWLNPLAFFWKLCTAAAQRVRDPSTVGTNRKQLCKTYLQSTACVGMSLSFNWIQLQVSSVCGTCPKQLLSCICLRKSLQQPSHLLETLRKPGSRDVTEAPREIPSSSNLRHAAQVWAQYAACNWLPECYRRSTQQIHIRKLFQSRS